MKVIPRTDTTLNWLGRWIEDGGKYSGWGGSALQFKFTGTSLGLEVVVKGAGGIAVMVDDYSDNWTHRIPLSRNGSNTITVATGLEDKEHTAFFRFWSNNYENKRNGIDYVKVISILIDDNAKISNWSGDIKLGYFGDSWASADNDFLRFLGLDNVEIHSISDPGLNSSDGVKRFPFAVGIAPIKDLSFNGVVIGYGVNDALSNIFKFVFKRNILKIIDKIRVNDPNVQLFLLQSPRNHATKVDTSRYGDILNKILKKRSNCVYISSRDIEDQLTWKDSAHLDTNGKHIYGKWLGEKLNNYY